MEDTITIVVKAKGGRRPYTPEHRALIDTQRLLAREEVRLAEIAAGTRRPTRGRPRTPTSVKVEFHARQIAELANLSFAITKNGVPQFRHIVTD